MRKISLKGVAIGNVTDIVFTNIVLIPLIIYVMASSGLTTQPDGHASAEILKSSTTFLIGRWVLGSIGSILGGYVAARIARHDEVLNGALSSILCVASGLYPLVSGTAAHDMWSHLIYLPISPALGALGGFLRLHQTTKPA